MVVVHIFTSEIVSSINYQARMFGDAYWSAADNPACTSKNISTALKRRSEQSSIWSWNVWHWKRNEQSTHNTTLAQSNCSNTVDLLVDNSTVLRLWSHWLWTLYQPLLHRHMERRCFSVCGDITAGKRNRLSKNRFSRVFLIVNSKYYWLLMKRPVEQLNSLKL